MLSNSVIYVSMYRGYTNVYSLYKSISLSNVLVFLLTRVRYVYARVQLVARAHTTLTITITIMYVHKRTTHYAHAHTNTRLSLYVTYSQQNKRALQHTHNALSNTRSQHAQFVFVLLVQEQTVIKQQTNKRFGFVGP